MEREQLERTAVHYPYLRGLLALPLGFMLIMSGLGNMEWGPFRQEALFVGSVVLALGGYVLITRYYEKNYGTVTPKRRATRVILGNVATLLGLAGGPIVIDALNLPFNGLAVSWALVALVYYSVAIGLRLHHVLIWGAVLVLGLLPIWGDPATSDSVNVGLIVVGAAIMTTGLFDHRVLVRMFESRETNGEMSNVRH